MKKIYTILLLAFLSISSFAQTDATDKVRDGFNQKSKIEEQGWTKQVILNIGLNQGMLENWAAGGERYSLAANGVFNGIAARIQGNTVWESTLDMFYGLNYVASNNFVPRKVDDRIDFSTRYGYTPIAWTNKKFLQNTYLMGLARLQTQFSKGFNYENPNWRTDYGGQGISNFISPLTTTLAVGAEYRKGKNFSIFVSPAAARIIMADKVYTSRDADGAFGIDSGKTVAFQFGAYLTTRYSVELSKSITYLTRLDLYSNYLKEPQNVDVLWDNNLSFGIGPHLGGNLGVTMVYDNDVPGQRDENGDLGALGWTQLKQVLNLGLQYKFPNKEKK